MKLILCLDDHLGMMFNHRRQSRDRHLIADLLHVVGESRLWISPYSAPLFPENVPNLTVTDEPCVEAGEADFVFAEDTDPAAHWSKVTTLIIYRWNRLYPSDQKFCGDMTGFSMTETYDFAGSSHDKITKEIWIK